MGVPVKPSNCQHPYIMKSAATFTLFFFIFFADARPRSFWTSICENKDALGSPSTCIHGVLPTPCGYVCKKGPGEICGGSGGQYGVCGDGLSCSECNRCSGCSYAAFKCYSESSCISSQDSWL